MDLSPRSERSIDGRVVEVGAQWNRPLSWPHLQVVGICDSVKPDRYHAEVRMGAHVLIRTEVTDELHRAQRAAEEAFTRRLAALFTD